MIRLENKDFGTIVKNILGESLLTKAIKKHSEKELEIIVGDLYEWLMEIGSNHLLDDFKPHQIKAIIEMMLKQENELPQDDTEMANWVRKNEDPLIENLARATGAYSMPREEFIKQQ